MHFDILTIFPQFFDSPFQEGIIRRALLGGQVGIDIHNIRDFALDKHAMTDDRPFGGGEGMVMKPEPLAAAIRNAKKNSAEAHVVLLSPRGRLFDQKVAGELAGRQHLVLVCGRYEGIDERIHRYFADDEISIGNYILTGGELAAMVIVDAVVRMLPGVLGCPDSAANDTFSRGLLKHPQYTRPRDFEGFSVPEQLLGGDHAAVSNWRFLASVEQTLLRRPDLLRSVTFSPAEIKLLKHQGIWDRVVDVADNRQDG